MAKASYDHSQCDGFIPRRHHQRDPGGEVWFGNQALSGLHCLVGSCVLGAHVMSITMMRWCDCDHHDVGQRSGHGGDDHGQLWQPVSMALHWVEVVGVVVWVLRHSIDLQLRKV